MAPVRITSRPYCIKGQWYYPQQHYHYSAKGIASYYGQNDGCHGNKTATGEVFNQNLMTAAHKTLPIPCYVRVTNLRNQRQVILKVNDRGPFYNNRIIDVSTAAAKALGFIQEGLAPVHIETLPEKSFHHFKGKRASWPSYYRNVSNIKTTKNAHTVTEKRIQPMKQCQKTLNKPYVQAMRHGRLLIWGPFKTLKDADSWSTRLYATGYDQPRVILRKEK